MSRPLGVTRSGALRGGRCVKRTTPGEGARWCAERHGHQRRPAPSRPPLPRMAGCAATTVAFASRLPPRPGLPSFAHARSRRPRRPTIPHRAGASLRRYRATAASDTSSRHRPSSRRTGAGKSAGSNVQSRSVFNAEANTSDTSSASNARRPVNTSKHDAKRPDVRATVDRLASGLLWRHVGGGAENHADAGHRGRSQGRRVGHP